MLYSDALNAADVAWTDAALDNWMANPGHFVPGTGMTFPGIKDS